MADNHVVIFSHPQVGSLTVQTGANQIQWSYGLNTQSYATYAGEVVQILSAYIDNLTITGDVATYKKMEEIYSWFIKYMMIATQGSTSNPMNRLDHYNEQTVTMKYPHRGWTLQIKPISLPTLRYGREVVVPNWTMEAVVEEAPAEMIKLTKEIAAVGDLENLHAGIGYIERSPFSSPDFPKDAIEKYLGKNKKLITANDLVDWYNSLIPSYLDGDFGSGFLSSFPGGGDGLFSKPAKGDDTQYKNTDANAPADVPKDKK